MRPAPDPTQYFVSLGDSGPAGTGATNPADPNPTSSDFSHSYIGLTYAHEAGRISHLSLENLACFGETTTSFLSSGEPNSAGGLPCAASPSSQYTAMVNFLSLHKKHIAFITIGLGGNDAAGSQSLSQEAPILTTVQANLARILKEIQKVAPHVPVFGTDYSDPGLPHYFQSTVGSCNGGGDCPGVVAAAYTVVGIDALNSVLSSTYLTHGAHFVDDAALFQTDDWSMTGSFNGQTVPQNVADECNWTWLCTPGSPFSLHKNDAGHAATAAHLESAIDAVVPAH